VRPFTDSMPVAKTYWIVCPKATAAFPKIATFREWLLAEASSDLRRLRSINGKSKPLKLAGTNG